MPEIHKLRSIAVSEASGYSQGPHFDALKALQCLAVPATHRQCVEACSRSFACHFSVASTAIRSSQDGRLTLPKSGLCSRCRKPTVVNRTLARDMLVAGNHVVRVCEPIYIRD
jgi:hypothetical protein